MGLNVLYVCIVLLIVFKISSIFFFDVIVVLILLFILFKFFFFIRNWFFVLFNSFWLGMKDVVFKFFLSSVLSFLGIVVVMM